MYSPLPLTSEELTRLNWSDIEPWYRELQGIILSQETLSAWLLQWSRLSELIDEVLVTHEIACSRNTADEEREQRQQRFLDEVYTHVQSQDQVLKEHLLISGLCPEGFAIPLRNLRTEAALFREANVPLLNEEKRLIAEYFQAGGSQMVTWEGKAIGISTLWPVLEEPDRARREHAWRAIHERLLADHTVRHEQWAKLLQLRQQIAYNAGYDDYRAYRWRQLLRFDYTPAESKAFHTLVEQEVVPVARLLWEKRRQMLGVEKLRPWDQKVNPWARTAPRPITDVSKVIQQCATLFQRIDPSFGTYFKTMMQEDLLDLEARPHKVQAGFNAYLQARRRSFIFGHVNSIQDIIPLVLHESGHAFHGFETFALPYIRQRQEGMIPTEFAEVASTSMELIGSMYLHASGICTQTEETQIRIYHLENLLLDFIPSIAQGDAFQHWLYEHPELAMDPKQLEQKWAELTLRYLPDLDWSGLESELGVRWQRILHFYYVPFYLLEYVFAALGALQIWSNYLRDPQRALQQYRHALSLGATRTVPELYAAAGATFSFDASTLRPLLNLVLQTIKELQTQL